MISEVLRQTHAAASDRDAAHASVTLAEIEFASGRAEEALQLSEQAAQFFRGHSDLVRLAMTLANSSAYLIGLRRYEEARFHAREALRCSSAVGGTRVSVWPMQHLAAIAVLNKEHSENDATLRRAANILGFVDETAKRTGKHPYYTEQQEYDKMLSTLHDALGEDELAKHMADGKDWPEDEAVAEALTI